jgi:hypothetical protein
MAEARPPIAEWLAWREARRTMSGWCLAYRDDGRVCREPASRLDRQRARVVCAAHAPAAATEPETGQEA